jgi:protein-L-isoaspartate(D-aspartate) O-methyltransferase
VADWRPGIQEYEVYQVGGRPVWEEVVDAYFQWVGWGEPHFSRFGMTVTLEGQRIWLDEPVREVG